MKYSSAKEMGIGNPTIFLDINVRLFYFFINLQHESPSIGRAFNFIAHSLSQSGSRE
jgi:hypothetical protein